MQTIVMGVDPGSRLTGFGVLSIETLRGHSKVEHISHGVIVLDEDSFSERIHALGQHFREILAKYKPQHVVLEKIFLGKNADSAFKLGHARGVLMYEAQSSSARVAEYATRVVKKSVTGSGAADKEQVQAVLQMLLKIPKIQRLDASDALAMAYHHGEILRRTQMLEDNQKLNSKMVTNKRWGYDQST